MNPNISRTLDTIRNLTSFIGVLVPNPQLEQLISQQIVYLQWQINYYIQINAFILRHSNNNIFAHPHLLAQKKDLLRNTFTNSNLLTEIKKTAILKISREILLIDIMLFLISESEFYIIHHNPDFLTRVYKIFNDVYHDHNMLNQATLESLLEGGILFGEYYVEVLNTSNNQTLNSNMNNRARHEFIPVSNNISEEIERETEKINGIDNHFLMPRSYSDSYLNKKHELRSKISLNFDALNIDLPQPAAYLPTKNNVDIENGAKFSSLNIEDVTITKSAEDTTTTINNIINLNEVKSATITQPAEDTKASTIVAKNLNDSPKTYLSAANNNVKDPNLSLLAKPADSNHKNPTIYKNNHHQKPLPTPKEKLPIADVSTKDKRKKSNQHSAVTSDKVNIAQATASTHAPLKIESNQYIPVTRAPQSLMEKIFSIQNIRQPQQMLTNYKSKTKKIHFNHDALKALIVSEKISIRNLSAVLLNNLIDESIKYFLLIHLLPTYTPEEFEKYNPMVDFKRIRTELHVADILLGGELKPQQNIFNDFINKARCLNTVNLPLHHLFLSEHLIVDDFFNGIINRYMLDYKNDKIKLWLDTKDNNLLHILLDPYYNEVNSKDDVYNEEVFINILNLLKKSCPPKKWGGFLTESIFAKNVSDKSPFCLLEARSWFKALDIVYDLILSIAKNDFRRFTVEDNSEEIYSNFNANNVLYHMLENNEYTNLIKVIEKRENFRKNMYPLLATAIAKYPSLLNEILGASGDDYCMISTANTSLMYKIIEKFTTLNDRLANYPDRNSDEYHKLVKQYKQLQEITSNQTFQDVKKHFMCHNHILNKVSPLEDPEQNIRLLQTQIDDFSIDVKHGSIAYKDMVCKLLEFGLDFTSKILAKLSLDLMIDEEIAIATIKQVTANTEYLDCFFKQSPTTQQKNNVLFAAIKHKNMLAIDKILSAINPDEYSAVFNFEMFKFILCQPNPENKILKKIGDHYNSLRKNFDALPTINDISQQKERGLLYYASVVNANAKCFLQLLLFNCKAQEKYVFVEQKFCFIQLIAYLTPSNVKAISCNNQQEEINMDIKNIFEILKICFKFDFFANEIKNYSSMNDSMILTDLLLCGRLIVDNEELETLLKEVITLALKAGIPYQVYNKDRATIFDCAASCNNNNILMHLIKEIEKINKDNLKTLISSPNLSGCTPLDTTICHYLMQKTNDFTEGAIKMTKAIFNTLVEYGSISHSFLTITDSLNMSYRGIQYVLNKKNVVKVLNELYDGTGIKCILNKKDMIELISRLHQDQCFALPSYRPGNS